MLLYDLQPQLLCNCRLQSQHVTLHYVWQAIRDGRTSEHPEIARWVGHRYALVVRHCALMGEYSKRRLSHDTPLELTGASLACLSTPPLVIPLSEQRERLNGELCSCGGKYA